MKRKYRNLAKLLKEVNEEIREIGESIDVRLQLTGTDIVRQDVPCWDVDFFIDNVFIGGISGDVK